MSPPYITASFFRFPFVETSPENVPGSSSPSDPEIIVCQETRALPTFGMGVVTVPSSASRSPFGVAIRRSSSPLRRSFVVLAFKGGRECAPLAASPEVSTITPEAAKAAPKKSLRRSAKQSKRANAVAADAAPATAPDARITGLDYNEVAAVLESIYKLSPADVKERRRRAKRGSSKGDNVVRSRTRRTRRLSLETRVSLKQRKKEEGETGTSAAGKRERYEADEDSETLIKEYSAPTELNSLDWKRMRIPPVLSSGEQIRLFKLMQPAKAVIDVKEKLHKDLNREPADGELAVAVNMSVSELRTHIEVGQAARNKLIKHNLRLVLFAINKYYPDIASGQKFQDLCQAGATGLITAIDRFEQKRGFQLSTYSLFWIRHSIIRSMTLSSFTKVPFGIESVRQEIQKAKLQLSFELGRSPTEEEIIHSVGISQERFQDIMKASKPVLSLNARHGVTQEEFIKGITDVDGAHCDKHRQSALLRLALDDVLDSLKPKENLVIRQRYGLDGKGDRTLGEIAGNLNISREMVRKHELKALLKLKHPTRVDYLRRYV